jgi:hypothetical protein
MPRKPGIKDVRKGETFIAYNPKDIINTQEGVPSDADPRKQSAWSSVKARQSKSTELELLAARLAEELSKQRKNIFINKS